MKSYYLAKVMADMPFQIVYPLAFVLIVYFMTSQPLDIMRLSMFVLMCILTSLVAQSLGLVIGCACDVQSAVYLGPISTIPILLFSGEIFSNKHSRNSILTKSLTFRLFRLAWKHSSVHAVVNILSLCQIRIRGRDVNHLRIRPDSPPLFHTLLSLQVPYQVP